MYSLMQIFQPKMLDDNNVKGLCAPLRSFLQELSNGVRRPRQIRGPKIRANVPPKGPC